MNSNRIKIVQRQITFLQHQSRLLQLVIDQIITIDSSIEEVKAILDIYNINYQIYLHNIDTINGGRSKQQLDLITNSLINYQKQLELLGQGQLIHRSYGSSDLMESIDQSNNN